MYLSRISTINESLDVQIPGAEVFGHQNDNYPKHLVGIWMSWEYACNDTRRARCRCQR